MLHSGAGRCLRRLRPEEGPRQRTGKKRAARTGGGKHGRRRCLEGTCEGDTRTVEERNLKVSWGKQGERCFSGTFKCLSFFVVSQYPNQ